MLMSAIFLAYFTCISAKSFSKRQNFEEIVCGLSTNQLSDFADCIEESMGEEVRNAMHNYVNCLDLSSSFNYFEKICSLRVGEVSDFFNKASVCYELNRKHLENALTNENGFRCLQVLNGLME
ncbi:uncharacterized protein [Centruroides vittatus]|uniref:uncharacterized protein n=1 Tax=Centruroides vittatus TaxID=120091 RepID=UPI00350ECE9E